MKALGCGASVDSFLLPMRKRVDAAGWNLQGTYGPDVVGGCNVSNQGARRRKTKIRVHFVNEQFDSAVADSDAPIDTEVAATPTAILRVSLGSSCSPMAVRWFLQRRSLFLRRRCRCATWSVPVSVRGLRRSIRFSRLTGPQAGSRLRSTLCVESTLALNA